MFKCDSCGSCCRNLAKNQLYRDLDNGKGICIHYMEETKKCSIYSERPIKCNVSSFYDEFLTNEMTKEEFYKINYKACKYLKQLED